VTNGVNTIAFVVLAVAILGGGLAMLAAKNIMHSAFWLLEVSVAAAALYYLLGAEYIALVQLLVYAGAVAVLIIFSIMISLRRREDAVRPRDFSPLAAVLGTLFFVVVAVSVARYTPPAAVTAVAPPDLAMFGRAMFSASGWSLPFEVASFVLLAALVGAVWWTREDDDR
jgi:NADH:ubiquinone oxidoreductase subunit 6 (subunit J)